MLADRFEQCLGGGQVTLLGDLAKDLGVLELVEVMAVGVEDAIATQPVRLVDLKVKTDGSHALVVLLPSGRIVAVNRGGSMGVLVDRSAFAIAQGAITLAHA